MLKQKEILHQNIVKQNSQVFRFSTKSADNKKYFGLEYSKILLSGIFY